MPTLFRIRFEKVSPSEIDPHGLSPSDPSLPSPDIPPNLENSQRDNAQVNAAFNITPATPFLTETLPTERLNPSTDLYPISLSSTVFSNTSGESGLNQAAILPNHATPSDTPRSYPTRIEVSQMIDEKLNGLRVYVLESDITQAQQAVKSVVELASF